MRMRIWKSGLWLLALAALLMVFASAAADDGEEQWPPIGFDPWVKRGEDVTIHAEHVRGFGATVLDVANGQEKELWDGGTNEEDSLTIPGSIFQHTGLYMLDIGFEGEEGYRSGGMAGVVNVVKPSSDLDDGEVHLALSADVFQTVGRYWIWVWAKGAERVALMIDGEIWDSDSDFGCYRVSYDAPEEQQIYAVAVFGDGTIKGSEHKTLEVQQTGTLGRLSAKIPDTLGMNEDLSITFSAVENEAEGVRYCVQVQDEEDGNSWYREWDELPAMPVVVPAAADGEGWRGFMPGRNYRVEVSAFAVGYDRPTVIKQIVCKGGEDKNLTLTVNGLKQGTIETPTRQELKVRISIPEDATALRFFNGYDLQMLSDWGEWEEWKQRGEAFFTSEVYEAQTVSWYAQAYYGEFEGNPWELPWDTGLSNVVMVKGIIDGKVGQASASLTTPAVKRGDFLKIEITDPGEGAENIYIGVRDEDVRGYQQKAAAGTRCFPTMELEPGHYNLTVESNAAGKEPARRDFAFTVAEPESGSPLFGDDPFLIMSKTEGLVKNERFVISGGAKGADFIRFLALRDGDQEDEADERGWYDGELFSDEMNLDDGDFWVYLAAHYFDEEGKETIRESERIRVSVATPEEGIDPCVIDAPAIAKAGEDYTFKVSGLEQADWWWGIEVWDEDDDDENDEERGPVFRADRNLNEIEESYTISGSQLKANHRYQISVWADAEGKRGAGSEAFFYVLDNTVTDENVRFEIQDGDTQAYSDTEVNAIVRQNLGFRITAEGAKALIKFNGRDWDLVWDFDPESGVAEFRENIDSENSVYFARACYEEIPDEQREQYERGEISWQELGDWSGISNMVKVNVQVFGWAGVPVLEVPETVERGDLLPVTIAELAENADEYHFRIRDRDWGEYCFYPVENPAQGDTLYLPTANLEPGKYRVSVDDSGFGYNWNTTDENDYWFTVTEPEGEQKTPKIAFAEIEGGKNSEENPLEIVLNREVPVSVFAPGAKHIIVSIHNVTREEVYGGPNSDGEVLQEERFRLDETGLYEIRAMAFYKDEGEEGNDPVFSDAVWVKAVPLGQLEPAVLTAETLVNAGEDFTFQVQKLAQLEQGNWWELRVEEKTYGGEWHDVWRRTADDGEPEERYTVPGGEDFPAAGLAYRLSAWVDADGYEGAYAYLDFFARDPDAAAGEVKLYVNGQEKAATVRSNETFEVRVVVPEGTQGVSIYDGDRWWLCDDAEFIPGSTEATCTWDMPAGVRQFLARATATPIDWEELERNGYRWGELDLEWSDVAELTLTITADGKLSVPVTWDVPDSVKQGEPFSFTVEGPTEATRLQVGIYDEEWRQYYWDDFTVTGFPVTVTALTANLEVGKDYFVQIRALAPGYEESETSDRGAYWFNVEAPDAEKKVTLTVNKTAVSVGENYTFEVFAPGAEKIEVFQYTGSWADVNQDEPMRSWQAQDYEGDSVQDGDSWWQGEGSFKLRAVAVIGGTAYESEEVSVTVSAKGSLAVPAYGAAQILEAGEAFDVTFSEVENAEWYQVRIETLDIHGELDEYTDHHVVNRQVFKAGTITIPANILKAGEVYRLFVDAWGNGYTPGQRNWEDAPRLAVVDKAKVLVLPSALTDIGAGAFADIDAQVVKLPKGTKVEDGAFAGSEHLIAVIGEDTNEISGDAFAYPKNCIVFAPDMD